MGNCSTSNSACDNVPAMSSNPLSEEKPKTTSSSPTSATGPPMSPDRFSEHKSSAQKAASSSSNGAAQEKVPGDVEQNSVKAIKAWKAFNDQGRAPVFRIHSANEAIQAYTKSRSTIKTHDHHALLSLAKNLGTVHTKLACMPEFWERNQDTSPSNLVEYHFVDGFKELLAALVQGSRFQKEASWLEGVSSKLAAAVQGLQQYSIECYENFGARCALIARVETAATACTNGLAADDEPRNLIRFSCALAALDELRKEVVRQDEKGNWRACSSVLGEMAGKISALESSLARMTKTWSKDGCPVWLGEEFKTATEKVGLLAEFQRAHTFKTLSDQHVELGLARLESVLRDEEHLDMDLVWEIMDQFKFAARQASDAGGFNLDLSIESEAKALASQGSVYYSILKMPSKARPLLLNAVQLSQAITESTGKVFQSDKWFQDATKLLQDIRDEVFARDKEALDKERAPILEKLAPQLKAMDDAANQHESAVFRAHNLLKHIYEHHPPLKEGHELNEDLKGVPTTPGPGKAAVRKGILKANLAYHPDKNKEHGVEWLVLCEQMTQRLNTYYNDFKG